MGKTPEPWKPEDFNEDFHKSLRRELMRNADSKANSLDAQIDTVVNNETALMCWSANGCAIVALEAHENQAYREWSSIAVSLAKKTDVDR